MAEFSALEDYQRPTQHQMEQRAAAFYALMRTRRTVREFSDEPVDRKVIVDCLKAAGTAPSGANLQPWQFVVIENPEIKQRIRNAAEAEEREFYETRATPEWLAALAPLGTDANKSFLETAPYLIAIFYKNFDVLPDGRKVKNYYAQESVGIAVGMLITAIHHAGLVSLTHTPSPMGFLNEILGRPKNERPFLLLVVGLPAEDAQVPAITKKPLEDFTTFLS